MKESPSAQSIILTVIVVGYVGLTTYALVRWNGEISAALVTGFALMAQKAVGEYFTWLHNSNGTGTPPTKSGDGAGP